jgi:hypothetical protein
LDPVAEKQSKSWRETLQSMATMLLNESFRY